MSEAFGKNLLKKYGNELDARERAHQAKGASDPVEETAVTDADVEAYTIPTEPKEGETKTIPQKTSKEWIKTLRETAGLTEVEAEKKQREAFLELVKKDPRTGQKYE